MDVTARSDPATAAGLRAAEVAERVAAGAVNRVDEGTSRPLAKIIQANVLTRFNAILGALLVAVLVVGGSPLDALFALVVVWNALIGIVQEVRAKRILDRLAVLNAPRATVMRDGEPVEVATGEVVRDDLVLLQAGDQVPADGPVVASDGLEIDESLLTGESDPLPKAIDDGVLSGSAVVAGSGSFRATGVGADAYAHRLAAEGRRFTTTASELRAGIDTLLGWITWGLVVVGPILLTSRLVADDESTKDAVIGTVAALVGMIPEGLVLLTSIAFFVGAMTLARRQVLVQELPAVEGLARVDVVCLDKTGTLTEGHIRFATVEPLGGHDADSVTAALAALAADPHPNATLTALAEGLPPAPPWTRTATVPFSSARKWSAATFDGRGTWVLGAPEIVVADVADDHGANERAATLAREGLRVVVLARTEVALAGETLPAGLEPAALVTFEEQIRPDAPGAMRYFDTQGVRLKVISGDNPATVGAIAHRVEVPHAGTPMDARELPEDTAELAAVLDEVTVLGRVTPQQKRGIIKALHHGDHVVAMTGDGVNDVLALKDADIGVAMGSGAPATRAVAQIVLLDGKFSHMPSVVGEGRRVIANIERVASLFLIKNVYSAVLAVAVAVARVPFPFLPRHVTLIGALTIGIPAFVFSLAPSNERYRPGFVRRVMAFSAPTGVLTAAAALTAFLLARVEGAVLDEARTAAAIVVMITGLRVLLLVARPLNAWKLATVVAMGAAFALALAVPAAREVFQLYVPSTVLVTSLVIGALAAVVIGLFWTVASRRIAAPSHA